ncbi:uncharacterized protein LOC135345926 [Halichondria panicea]|uniref:uncharacterized protein LOC135345926 n=1 Tax=Halichondria panicea TaxID=6063 RepID=UPI00312BBD82
MKYTAYFSVIAILVSISTRVQGQSACSTCNEGDGQFNGLCKCDGKCELFGDCCESTLNTITPPGFVCRSIYPDNRIEPQVNESFWMVSSCPSSWSTDDATQALVRDNCVSLNSSLPPITDISTGMVYSNDFCAICNRARGFAVWQPDLACTSYVYEQLAAVGIQQLLAMDPTIFQTQCQTCSYQAPSLTSIPRPRSCFPSISSCLDLSSLEVLTRQELSEEMYTAMIKTCENGPYDIVMTKSGTLYRNQNCAVCNGEQIYLCLTDSSTSLRTEIPLECAPVHRPLEGIVPPLPTRNGIPFTITLSNLGGGQVQVSVMTEMVTVTVDCPDGEAALGLECRPTLCPEGYIENGGRCAFLIGSSANTTTQCLSGFVALNISDYVFVDNDTLLYNGQVLMIVEFDLIGQPVVCLNNSLFGEFFDCPSGLVALNNSEFTDLGNNTIVYEEELFSIVEYDDFGRPIICPPNGTTIVRSVTIYSYPEGYFILTYIGCSLSVIGSAIVLLTYGIFKSLRTLPSLILMNVSAAILLNNLFIIIGGPVTQAFPNIELCKSVAICLHFFFLSQFSWMTIMSFQMARTFYQATKMKLDSKYKQKVVFGVYFVVGWSLPLAITVTSILVDFTTEDLVLYGVLKDGRLGSCWINHLESAIVAFIVPLVISLVVNMVLFLVVTTYLCLAARSSSKLDKKHNLPFFRVNAAVFSVTGLTWVFGFIALLAGTNWAWYPFIILNSTQGFVIFVAFLLTKHVFALYWNLLVCRTTLDTTKPSKSGENTSRSQQKTLQSSTTEATLERTLDHMSTKISLNV